MGCKDVRECEDVRACEHGMGHELYGIGPYEI
jgi:hypothetical protein